MEAFALLSNKDAADFFDLVLQGVHRGKEARTAAELFVKEMWYSVRSRSLTPAVSVMLWCCIGDCPEQRYPISQRHGSPCLRSQALPECSVMACRGPDHDPLDDFRMRA